VAADISVGSRVFCEKAKSDFCEGRVVKKYGKRRYLVEYVPASKRERDLVDESVLVLVGKRK